MLIIGKFERPPRQTLYSAVTSKGVTKAYEGEIGMLKALAEAGFSDDMDHVVANGEIARFSVDLEAVMPGGLLLLSSSVGCVIFMSGEDTFREWFETVEEAIERSAELCASPEVDLTRRW